MNHKLWSLSIFKSIGQCIDQSIFRRIYLSFRWKSFRWMAKIRDQSCLKWRTGSWKILKHFEIDRYSFNPSSLGKTLEHVKTAERIGRMSLQSPWAIAVTRDTPRMASDSEAQRQSGSHFKAIDLKSFNFKILISIISRDFPLEKWLFTEVHSGDWSPFKSLSNHKRQFKIDFWTF